MRGKLILSLGAIAVVLLLSSVISVLEYSKMSSYVSDLIAKDVDSINDARRLGEAAEEYNLAILAAIGDGSVTELPDFDAQAFMQKCDSLSAAFTGTSELADSVKYAYSAYMLTSLELGYVIKADFINTRGWYFDRLQPRFNRLRRDIDNLSLAIYGDLSFNADNMDSSLYRSIIPGIVAVGVGLLLVVMLLLFMLSYYVNPTYRMAAGLSAYRSYNKKYNVSFEGDDQLREINDGIAEITDENQTLRKRIIALKNEPKGGQ
ncbi:MAG: hypothetical protein J5667_02335 [Bacteroidales bacterium]|nr:hypothetical protein [Bacteroidales bacterium]